MNYFSGTNSSRAIALQTELPLDQSVATARRSWLDSQFRNGLLGRLKDVQGGSITVREFNADPVMLGHASDHPTLHANVVVRDRAFFRKIFLGGTIGSAESYMDGDWGTDNLTDLIRIIIRNLDQMTDLEKGWARLKNVFYWAQHLARRNSVEGSRKNIHEHYDLGNDFYQLFLDPTMSYSSGIFDETGVISRAAMEDASNRKMNRICQKLQLQPSDHVLEIGTGWGGMAIFMAGQYGCRVTTTTISQEQHRYAVDAVNQAGLQDRITVLLKDYRHLTGRYDKIVSIEMIEAVGHQYYDQYFSKCSSLLADDGLMLLQAITMAEQNFDYHVSHVDFIRRYVFPGGCLPSITALSQSVGRRDGHESPARGRHHAALCDDAALLAESIHGPAGPGPRIGLRRVVYPALEFLPLLLRSCLCGTSSPPGSSGLQQTRMSD